MKNFFGLESVDTNLYNDGTIAFTVNCKVDDVEMMLKKLRLTNQKKKKCLIPL